MDLLERDGALALLEELLAASTGGGRIALVSGEAGVGKSALVTAFTAAARPDVRVLTGACDPLLTPRALGPLYDIAHQVGGRLAGLLAAGEARETVLAELLDTLGEREPRSVVVVEDAHWADEATLDMLVFLGRRLARHAALIVVTYRDDEVDADHPLRSAVAALPREGVLRVPLSPLSSGAVAELARRVGRSPSGVHELTGGNALLVTEILASDQPGVPPTVRDLALARMRSLPPTARHAAHVVAVSPTRAESYVIAHLASEVEACLAHGVLVPAGDGVAFRHELLRQAVEESLSPPRRTAMHAAVLDSLERIDGVDPARLVHHAHHAGDVAAVLRHARAAAQRAATLGSHREAGVHYRTLLSYGDRLSADERTRLLEDCSFQEYLAGQPEPALEARRQALAARQASGDLEMVGEDLRWISRLAWWTGRADEAREAAERAVDVLEHLPPGRQLAMAYSNRSQLHMLSNDAEAAIAWGRRAQELADQLGDVETGVHASINIGTARMQVDDPAGPSMLERAHDTAAAAGLDDHAARALVNLAFLTMERSDYLLAADRLARALAFASEHELDGYLSYLLAVRAVIRVEQGEWDGARADAENALSRPWRGATQVPALVALARLRTRCGEAGALALLDRAAAYAEASGELQRIGPVSAARSEYFWLENNAERAADEARHGLELALRIDHPWLAGELAFRLWRVGGLAEVPAGIPEVYRAAIKGDWRAAADAWGERGALYARAEALSLGDDDAATEALQVMDDLGATRAAQRLRFDLRSRGVARIPRGPRAATSANPLGLTPRQLDVVALLAEGLTNAEIAERLFVSAKTVDHHVSAVLAKLDVSTRGQAAAEAHRLGLTQLAPPR